MKLPLFLRTSAQESTECESIDDSISRMHHKCLIFCVILLQFLKLLSVNFSADQNVEGSVRISIATRGARCLSTISCKPVSIVYMDKF